MHFQQVNAMPMADGALRTLWRTVGTHVGQERMDVLIGLVLSEAQECRARYGEGHGALQKTPARELAELMKMHPLILQS